MSQSDIINSRQIQWFPGHMTKTLRLMERKSAMWTVFCRSLMRASRFPA